MQYLEDILPSDRRYDTVLQDFREEIVDGVLERKKINKDIIDPVLELSRDTESFWSLSNLLAVAMHSEGENLPEVQKAVYRGMAFAWQIVEEVKSGPIHHISLGEIIDTDSDYQQLADKIRLRTSSYIANRRHIDDLLFSFMPELDESHRYNHHVKTGALLIFILCEIEEAETYVLEASQSLNPEDLM